MVSMVSNFSGHSGHLDPYFRKVLRENGTGKRSWKMPSKCPELCRPANRQKTSSFFSGHLGQMYPVFRKVFVRIVQEKRFRKMPSMCPKCPQRSFPATCTSSSSMIVIPSRPSQQTGRSTHRFRPAPSGIPEGSPHRCRASGADRQNRDESSFLRKAQPGIPDGRYRRA